MQKEEDWKLSKSGVIGECEKKLDGQSDKGRNV
jgi:hypothetical protein